MNKSLTFRSPLPPWTRQVLPNGMRLVVKEVHTAPVVAVNLWAATGAADEPESLAGISHFYEHMFFKGSLHYPLGEMDRRIKGLGGYNNAATSVDYTQYFVVLPARHHLKAIDVLADPYLNPTFPVEEIERERMVVYEEIRRKEDSPTGKLFSEFLMRLFSGTPYEREILGTSDGLERITRQSLLEYHDKRYDPGNTVLVIVGDVETEKTIQEVQEIFADFQAGPTDAEVQFESAPLCTAQQFTVEKEVQQCYLLIGFATPAIANTGEEFALDIVATLLGEGRSSRLYRALQEETGLVSQVETFYDSFRRGGFFAVYGSMDAKNLDRVQQILWEELARIREQPVSETELQKAKVMICSDFAFSNERVSSIANTLGDFETNFNITDACNYLERVQAISPEEILETVSKYCRQEQALTGVVRPEGG